MKDILLYGGIGLAAYVLYEMFYGASTVVAPSTTTGTTVTSPPPDTSGGRGGGASVVPVISGGGVTTTTLLARAGGGNPLLTPQQWNWYYARLTGQTDAQQHNVQTPSNAQIDVNAYLALRASSGVSGVMSVQGMTRW